MTFDFPLVGLVAPSDGIPSLLPKENTKGRIPAITNNPVSKTIDDAIGMITKRTSGNFLGTLFDDSSRYLTGILGLILIVGGIFLFKPVRETVVSAGKMAAKGAELAA